MKHRILVVDDEPHVRLNYRITLEVEGYEVVETASSFEGLQKLIHGEFDLAILDMRMPRMSGLDLLQAMRDGGLATPAVIITAFSDVPHAVRAMKLGAIDFLQKPLRPTELRKVVSEIVGRHDADSRPAEVDDFETHITAAKRLINLRQFDTARVHLLRALEINDRSAEAFNLAGVLAEMNEDYQRARRYYGRAIRIDKSFEPAQQNMRRLFEVDHFGSSDEPVHLGDH